MKSSQNSRKRRESRSSSAESKKGQLSSDSSILKMASARCGFRAIMASPEMVKKMRQGKFDCQELLKMAGIESGKMACVIIPVQASGTGKSAKK